MVNSEWGEGMVERGYYTVGEIRNPGLVAGDMKTEGVLTGGERLLCV